MTKRELIHLLEESVRYLYREESEALRIGVSERNLVSKMYCFLQPKLKKKYPNLKLDCEYNKRKEKKHGVKKNSVKRSNVKASDAERNRPSRPIIPDIVFHSPGNNNKNIFVIEVKKDKARSDDKWKNSGKNGEIYSKRDVKKIKCLVNKLGNYRYKHGVCLIIKKKKIWYYDGENEESRDISTP